jgi:hypothetical protein
VTVLWAFEPRVRRSRLLRACRKLESLKNVGVQK